MIGNMFYAQGECNRAITRSEIFNKSRDPRQRQKNINEITSNRGNKPFFQSRCKNKAKKIAENSSK